MFLEAIALSLVKTLSSFLFSKMLVYSDINIQGAPSWYQKADSEYVCVSTYNEGGLEAVDVAKDNAKKLLINKINEIIEIVVYDNYRNLQDKSEKLFISTFLKDEELPTFVNKNIDYKNIEYIEKSKLAFVRGCIGKDTLLGYEKERIGIIKNKLTHKRADNAFDELDNSTN
ncbi:MAG: hypothetical protein LDL13_03695 [Calditerrivibrio sp.]|nr:hypothetical protein [Calditerrivibrio sp.]MCA1932661.1 hypothetical protein [Calditerrivibrio sp.]MCA1980265.1 hypothetical protein [Calditerrivibrio sp.]